MEFIKPRYEHKDQLFWWNVIAHQEAKWSVWDGLEFSDYYFLQHRIFTSIKIIKCFGYRPEDHPAYKKFCEKYK